MHATLAQIRLREGRGSFCATIRLRPLVTASQTILHTGAPIPVFTLQPIGFVRSFYTDTKAIPKGLGAKHDAEGVLEILPEFELGLTDIEGFSHLFVIWAFDRAEGFDLVETPPSDNRPHGVFATRSPRRPHAMA